MLLAPPAEQSNSAAQFGAQLFVVFLGPTHLAQHLRHTPEGLVNVA
jgi:hypothetical protein